MIYLAILIVYLFLAISFLVKDRTLGMISSLGIMTVGVYIGINGISYLNNFLEQTIAIISIALGAYLFIVASLENIEEIGI